ncbi:ribosome-inactivating family protein [Streptomyces sp. NPDC002623]
MSNRMIHRVGIPAVLSTALVGAVMLQGVSPVPTTSSAATAHSATKSVHLGAHDIDLAAYAQLSWDVSSGSSGWAAFINSIRTEARNASNPATSAASSGGTVDITNKAADANFVDIAINYGGENTVHFMMRLSDYYIVSYYFIDEHTDRTYYYPLASGDLPATPSGWVYRNRFQGHENYNTLASDGQTSLTNVTIGPNAVEASLIQLRDTAGSASTADMSRALLRMILTVAEPARFRPLATRFASVYQNFTTTTLTANEVNLIRNWQNVSSVFVQHWYGSSEGQGTDSDTSSIELPGYGLINNAPKAAALLLTALALNFPTYYKDEL